MMVKSWIYWKKLLTKQLVIDKKNCSRGLEAIAVVAATTATAIIAASKHGVRVNTVKKNIISVWLYFPHE